MGRRSRQDRSSRHGFDTEELAAQMAAAGFSDVTGRRCHEIVRGDHRYPLFLAIGVLDGAPGG